MRFVWFSYYKTANRIAPCGVVRCDALLLVVRYGYTILRAVLVRFLRFMQFGEHPISLLFISIMVIFIILATLSNFGQISLNLLPLYLELETTLARMHGKSSGKQLKPQL